MPSADPPYVGSVSDGFLTLHEAAERLGVHYMTAYRYVRLGVLPAEKSGGSWRVREVDVAAFGAGTRFPVEPGDGDDTVTEVEVGSGSRRRAPWSERLEARLTAGDGRGAWSVVEAALSSGASVDEVYLDIISPALRRIGQRWADGELDVAAEHRATGIAFRLIGRLGPRFARRGRTRGTVLIGTPPGERHSMPTAMFSDLIRGEGFEVSDLGADMPVDAFVSAALETPDLVAIGVSVTSTDHLDAAAELLAALHAAVPDVVIVVGGRAVPDAAAAERLGGEWASDAAGFLGVIEGQQLDDRAG